MSAVLIALLLAVPAIASAQSGKKVLTQDTYDLWRSISQPTLSADGKWAVYTLTPTVGDGELVARSTSGDTEYRVPRGWTGRPIMKVGASSFSPQAAQVTGDSKFVVFLRYPTKAAVDSATKAKAKPADQPKNTLAILSLADGRVTEVERVKGFRIAEKGGRFVIYEPEKADTSKAGESSGRAGGRGARGAGAGAEGGEEADSTKKPKRKKDSGELLVLREIATGVEVRIENVTDYTIDDEERWLVYALAGADSLGIDGVYARELATGSVTTLQKGTGNYRGLTLDEKATQVAFVTDADQWTAEDPRFTLYHAQLTPLAGERNGSGPNAGSGNGSGGRSASGSASGSAAMAASVAVAADAVGEGMRIVERGGIRFVREGNVLTFGVQPIPPDSIPADSLIGKAVVDLWHWRDARPQPMQKLRAGADRNRSYSALYDVATGSMRQLENDSMPRVQLSDDGRIAVSVTGVPYEIDAIYGEDGNDVYVINTASGDARKIATRIRGSGQLSPDAKYVIWWEDKAWRAHDIAANLTRELTPAGQFPGVSFEQETHDTPSEPRPWGVAGWSEGDARVLIYDRYDIWEVDPTGRTAARNLTDGVGRERNITFRVADLDPDEEYLDPNEPLWLEAFDNASKDAGIWRDRIGASAKPVSVVMAPKSWRIVEQASDADQLLVTREDYREYPDLWTGKTFDKLHRISNAMPEQSEYLWGDVEIVKWLNSDGVPLEGLLYTPEGFDPSKKYPMVVYFYEQLSDNLNNYVRPAGRNTINPTVYTSLGYLVFMPNIHYTPGYPGPSSVKAIVPGVQSLIAKGFVHADKVGIAGQSWGGYQTSYIITQTQIFAAAVPNATVVNMTSAYGGIRWGSGVERAIVNYEQGQSRIGGSLWEYPERYIENSALFYLDRVTTPVLTMHNDSDGAVPWYQGIEFFIAMRRLGKEAYLVNYNGDEHNPRVYPNQKDIDRRMQEFFAAKLQGAPEPDWMKHGIPFIERERAQIGH